MVGKKSVEVAVFGSVNLDTSYFLHHLPEPGETVLGLGRLDAPGGKGANQAVAIAALGAEVDLVAAVGGDEAGKLLIESLKGKKVRTDQIVAVPTE